MKHGKTVTVIAGLAVLGTITGVGIGRSTIAQVKPGYYQTAGSHFYADLSPNRSTGAASEPAADDYLQADDAYSAAPNCIQCGQYPIDYKPVHDASVDVKEASWRPEVASEPAAEEAETAVAEPPPANREWIERYTSYTVAAEPVVETEESVPATDNS